MVRNFAFAEEDWPAVAQYGGQAEHCAFTDPEMCLLKLRHLTEALTAALLGPERPAELYAAIDELGRRYKIPWQVLKDLHHLRRQGNRAAHHDADKQISFKDSLHALNTAHQALNELVRIFRQPPPNVPSFLEPTQRLPLVELERLLAQKDAELAVRESLLATSEAEFAKDLGVLREKREVELARDIEKRREKLERVLAVELANERESKQISLFETIQKDAEQLRIERLEAIEAELTAYRAERLGTIERELVAARERHEHEAAAIAPTPVRRPSPPSEAPGLPFKNADVRRGLPGPGLSDALWQRYVEWIQEEVPSDRILALLDPPTRTSWTALLKGEPAAHIAPSQRPESRDANPFALQTGEQRVHTPVAWIRRELTRWWPLVESTLEQGCLKAAMPAEAPLFVEVTLAQHLMERFSRDRRAPEGDLLEAAETPRVLQNVQMLDALARGIENGASLFGTDGAEAPPCERLAADIVNRLKEGADPRPSHQRVLEDMRQVLVLYLEGMLAHRILDFALALDLFTAVLWPHPIYQAHLRETTTHLLVENLDEAPARLLWLYREWLEAGVVALVTLQEDDPSAPVLESFTGGLRAYLGADPEGGRGLADRMHSGQEPEPPPKFLEFGRAWHDALNGRPRPVATPFDVTPHLAHVTFSDMIAAVSEELSSLLESVPTDEVALVVPTLDPLIIWMIRRQVEQLGHSIYVFAGTNRLTDYRSARFLLTLAKLAYPDWELPPSGFEVLEVLEFVTEFDPIRLGTAAERLLAEGVLGDAEVLRELAPELSEAALGRYEAFHAWLQCVLQRPVSDLSVFFRHAFGQLYAPAVLMSSNAEPDERSQREISHVGQLIEMAAEFQKVDARCTLVRDPAWGRRFMDHLGASPILERPFYKREPRRKALMLSTANQMAERGYRASGDRLRHLFLLDLGSERWWKPDHKELVNPWVLSHRWPGGRFSLDDAQRRMNEKLAKVLFTCCLKPSDSLHLHGCLVDAEGRENLGELPAMLEVITGRAAIRRGVDV